MNVELRLQEFRSMFERVNTQGLHAIENLMKESTDFEYCYKHFMASQGKMVRLCFYKVELTIISFSLLDCALILTIYKYLLQLNSILG